MPLLGSSSNFPPRCLSTFTVAFSMGTPSTVAATTEPTSGEDNSRRRGNALASHGVPSERARVPYGLPHEATQRAIPIALIHVCYTPTLHGHVTTRKPVGRVRKDHLNTPRGYKAHQLDAVGQVHNRPWLSIAPQLVQPAHRDIMPGGLQLRGERSQPRLRRSSSARSTNPVLCPETGEPTLCKILLGQGLVSVRLLALHGAARQRAHDVTLEQDEDDDDRCHGDDAGCRQVVQGYGVRVRLEVHESDGDWVEGAVV